MKYTGDELLDFVRASLNKGLSRAEIEIILIDVGWPADQVKDALGSFANVKFPVPVPKPKPYHSAKETFLYLILFTTLILSAFHFGNLLFQIIELSFPDATIDRPSEWNHTQIRWAISFILVSFPIFLFVTYQIKNAIRKDPEKRRSKIRKWLTYLTLFIAATIVIGDATTLIYNLLSGELTIRFILKVLTIGIIAGAVFSYYLRNLRQDEGTVN